MIEDALKNSFAKKLSRMDGTRTIENYRDLFWVSIDYEGIMGMIEFLFKHGVEHNEIFDALNEVYANVEEFKF